MNSRSGERRLDWPKSLSKEYYDHDRHPTCKNFRDASEMLLRRLLEDGSNECRDVCEVGAGNALIPGLFGTMNRGVNSMTLLDLSIDMLRHSFDYRGGGAQLVVGDVENLPFASGSFDLIVSNLGDAYNTEAFWRGMACSLRRGGRVLFTTPSYRWASCFRRQSPGELEHNAFFRLMNGETVYVPSIILPIERQSVLIGKCGLILRRVLHASLDELPGRLSSKIEPRWSGEDVSPATAFEAVKPM